MRILELEDVQLHWREDGDPHGSPIVFANSLGTDLRLWDDILPHLAEGARYIRFDLRGHGLTSCPPPPFSLDDLTSDVSALLDGQEIRGCTFVGTSIGGMIGQSLATKRPDLVQDLVLTNTAPKMGDAETWAARIGAVCEGGLDAIADDVMQRWFGPKFLAWPEVELWRRLLTHVDPKGYVGCCNAIAGANLSGHLKDLSQRTLIIGGAQDRACPSAMVESMHTQIPNSVCHILQDVGHLPSIEAPQMLAGHINEFLKEVRNV